jgi:hypothetical protein
MSSQITVSTRRSLGSGLVAAAAATAAAVVVVVVAAAAAAGDEKVLVVNGNGAEKGGPYLRSAISTTAAIPVECFHGPCASKCAP